MKRIPLHIPRLPVPGASAKTHEYLGVQIDEEWMKVVFVRETAFRKEVVDLSNQEIQGLDDAQIAGRLAQTVARLKLLKPKTCLIVSLQSLITRVIEIPSKDPDEIREIVNLQGSRHTPFTRAEIVFDTLTLGTVRDNYTKLMLVIVPKSIVNRHTAIVEKAGLKIEKVLFPPEALAFAYARIRGDERGGQPTALLHMDAAYSTFMVVQKGKLLFVRSMTVGMNHLARERELHTERFLEELQRSMEAYQADEAGPPAKEAALTGPFAENADWTALAAEGLKLPLRFLTYHNHFPIAKAAKEAAGGPAVSFFDVVASVLSADKMHVDLSSEERKMRRQIERRGRQIFRAAILLLVILSLGFVDLAVKLQARKTYYDRLASRYKSVRDEAKSLEQDYAKTRAVKEYLGSRGVPLETLLELYERTPLDLRLSYIKCDDNGKMTLRGTSRVMASAFSYVQALEQSPLFKNAKAKHVTSRSENGADVADFEINCVIEGTTP